MRSVSEAALPSGFIAGQTRPGSWRSLSITGIRSGRRTIDAFRDGEENPDTDLDNGQEDLTDLYRLYLDAGTVNETLPLNVVLVLDYSGSMNPRADDPRRESYFMDGQTRYEVLRDTVCPADRDGMSRWRRRRPCGGI